MLRTTRFVVAALFALATTAFALPAFGAPTGWQSVDVTFHSEQQQTITLVSGELPATAKLPYETELAIPAGTQLQWIGEILGGAAADDPEVKYVKTTVGGMDIYRFTLTKSRIGMLEGTAPGAPAFDGTTYVSAQKWTAWQAVPQVRISQRVPKAAQIAQTAPGAVIQAGDTTYSYYTKTVKNPKAGDVVDLAFSYTLPAAGAAATGAAAPGSGSSTAIVVFIAILFIGGLGFLAFKVQRKMNAKNAVDASPAPRKTKSSTQASKTAPAPAQEESEAVGSTPAKKARPLVPMLIVIVVLVAGVVYAAGQGTTARVDGGVITKTFSTAEPCASATVPVVASAGVDLAAKGAELIDAFTGAEGITKVTLNLASSTVDIGYCESSQSEASVRQILSGTGLVSVNAAPAVPTPPTASVEPSATK